MGMMREVEGDGSVRSEPRTQNSEPYAGLRPQDPAPSTQRSRLTPHSRWLGAAVSAGSLLVLVALLWGSDWTEVATSLATAQPGWLIAALGLALGVEIAKAVRWQLLLGLDAREFPRLLALLFTGRLLNLLAPLRAGDLWRVASVVKSHDRPLLVAGGTVVVEKLLDGAGLGIASAFLASHLWTSPAWLFPSALLAALLLVAMLAIAFKSRIQPVETNKNVVPDDGKTSRALTAGNGFTHHGDTECTERSLNDSLICKISPCFLRVLRVSLVKKRLLAATLLLTAAGLGLGLLANLLVLHALGLAGWQAALAMLLAGYAVGLVPSGPAQLGVYEVAVAAPLVALGMPATSAVVAALALHLVLLAGLVVGGLVAIALSGHPSGRRMRRPYQ